MALYATPAIITGVYYAVPGAYTIGRKFGRDLKAAIAAARETITRHDYGPGIDSTLTRAFVDRREMVKWADGSGTDRVVERIEVFIEEADLT